MTRIMYDSVTALDIPQDAAMVAGYIDGHYAWSPSDWDRFPHAVKVRIAVFAATADGHVLDVETGDATPVQAVSWVSARRAAGADPTVYCSASLWTTVWATFDAWSVAQPHYWIADYNGNPAVSNNAVAHQYLNPPASGGHFDLSVVSDYWPGVDPEMPLTPDDVNLILDTPVAKQGPDGATGFTTLRGVIAWNDAQWTSMHTNLTTDEQTLLAAIKSTQAMDPAVLAPLLVNALVPLLPPEVTPEQFIAALATHLSK